MGPLNYAFPGGKIVFVPRDEDTIEYKLGLKHGFNQHPAAPSTGGGDENIRQYFAGYAQGYVEAREHHVAAEKAAREYLLKSIQNVIPGLPWQIMEGVKYIKVTTNSWIRFNGKENPGHLLLKYTDKQIADASYEQRYAKVDFVS